MERLTLLELDNLIAGLKQNKLYEPSMTVEEGIWALSQIGEKAAT